MNTFTNENITALRKDVEEALRGVSNKHGISMKMGGITYSVHECRFKVTSVCKKDDNGNLLSPMEKAYLDKKSRTSGMRELGDTFESRGSTFTIVGWKPKNIKYPLIANNEVGQSYKFPERNAFKDE